MFSIRAPRTKFVRMASTLLGRSGRVYSKDTILRAHPKDPERNIYFGRCEGKAYILKPVSEWIFKRYQELRHEFKHTLQLRTHVDDSPENHVLVFEALRNTLLDFVMSHADLPMKSKKFILREVALALRDLHSKNWAHLDVKPDSVLLDWSRDETGQFKIERVVLGDLDTAYRLRDNEFIVKYNGGNVMWRSPEGQAGKYIGKPSEVFSFGLMCIHVITGSIIKNLPDVEKLRKDDVELEYVILCRLLSNFGPLPPGLITHIDDEWWGELMTKLCQSMEGEEGQIDRFEQWDEKVIPNLDSEVKRFILTMCHLDPRTRATMQQVLDDPWWGDRSEVQRSAMNP